MVVFTLKANMKNCSAEAKQEIFGILFVLTAINNPN